MSEHTTTMGSVADRPVPPIRPRCRASQPRAVVRVADPDIGVLRPPMSGSGLASHTIAVERLVLAVAADHSLAVEPVIAMEDLRAEKFVLFSGTDSAANDAVMRSCLSAGFAPLRAHEAAGIAVLLPLVAADLGVALVPASVRAAPLDGVVFRDVADAASVELALVWREDETNPAVLAVLEVLAAQDDPNDDPSGDPSSSPLAEVTRQR